MIGPNDVSDTYFYTIVTDCQQETTVVANYGRNVLSDVEMIDYSYWTSLPSEGSVTWFSAVILQKKF
jgi:hypothetical protein